jgi:cytochrome c553
MRTMTFALVVACTFSTHLFALTKSGDAARGKKLSEPCAQCHGATGNETKDGQYPKLAGQHASYLQHTIHAYKNGERVNAAMGTYVEKLSDQDIADLATFFANQSADLHDLSHTE